MINELSVFVSLWLASIWEKQTMFSLFKSDPVKKLKKQLAQKQEQAMLAQRSGDIRKFATLTEESQVLADEIKRLES